MISYKQLNHPFVFHAFFRLCIPFPPGTRVISLREELDEGDDGERRTPAGSTWTVYDVRLEYRCIICEATGGEILPTVQELYSEFTTSLRGWHRSEGGPRWVVVSNSFPTCPSVLVRSPAGVIFRVHREQILRFYSPPRMTYSSRLQRFVPC
jgi:hypothetical protein